MCKSESSAPLTTLAGLSQGVIYGQDGPVKMSVRKLKVRANAK